MYHRLIRPLAVIAVLSLTIGVFVYYFLHHPEVARQLGRTSPGILALLFGLYIVFMLCLGVIFQATLLLCRVRLPFRETALVTMYSSIINFFGPLQSGPAFRAVYLKKQHGVKLKDYTIVTAVYYLFYAAFSGLFLLSGLLKWWLVPLAFFGLLVAYGLYVSGWKRLRRISNLHARGLLLMAGTALLQVSIIALLFFTELRAVDPHVSFGQSIIYTGAANFALFVAITPGAIGFRESFLLFSQHLHHISTPTIAAANLLDRSVYIVLLLLLLAVIFATHAQKKLRHTE